MHHWTHGAATETAVEPAVEPGAWSPGAITADRRRWWLLALLGAAQFMLIIDVTVVNVALPSIGKSLVLDRSQLTWIVTAYTLFFGSLLVLGGRLADAFGRRRMFLTGLGLFVAASLGSGLAPDGNVLVITRSLQGIAASMLSPAALSMVTTTFQGPERNRALAVWAALAGTGAAVGVVLGGVLTSGPGWQWIFFINVPVGVLVALGVTRLVAAGGPRRARMELDLPGGVTFALAIASLLWAVIDAGDNGWTSATTLVRLGAAVAFLVVFAWRERATSVPLVRLEMLADRRFSGAVGLMLTASVVLGAMVFLDTLYLQLAVGLSAIETGLLFLPMALALIVGSQWGVLYIGHHGQRGSAVTGFVAAGLGMLYLSRLPTSGDVLIDVLPGLIVTAFGIGAIFVSATTTAFSRVSDEEAGRASGFVNTSHEVGLSLGAALASTIGGASLAGGAGAGGGGFNAAFLACVVVAAIGVVVARGVMPTTAPAVTAGRRMFAH
ncbi:MAG: MFS transporter [Acidimicrobiales bacterium]